MEIGQTKPISTTEVTEETALPFWRASGWAYARVEGVSSLRGLVANRLHTPGLRPGLDYAVPSGLLHRMALGRWMARSAAGHRR
jgi:hypothetical protein